MAATASGSLSNFVVVLLDFLLPGVFMIRFLALAFLLLAPSFALAIDIPQQAQPPKSVLHGMVADSTGAIISGAQIELLDPSGAVAATSQSGADGSFVIAAPRPGTYTLVVSQPGFKTTQTQVAIAAPGKAPASSSTAQALAAPVHIVLSIAATSSNVVVSADSNRDLTRLTKTATHP